MIHFISTLSISHVTALELLNICIQKSNDLKVPFSICIVDSSGNEIISLRMDNASLATLNNAKENAKEIVFFKHEETVTDTCKGLPLLYHNELIGAVSISGNNSAAELACLEFIKNEFQKL